MTERERNGASCEPESQVAHEQNWRGRTGRLEGGELERMVDMRRLGAYAVTLARNSRVATLSPSTHAVDGGPHARVVRHRSVVVLPAYGEFL